MAEKRVDIVEDINKGLDLDQLAQKPTEEGEMHVKRIDNKESKENRK